MMRCSAKTNADRVCKNKVSRMRGEVYCPVHRASHETPEQAQKRAIMAEARGGYGRQTVMETVWKKFGEAAAEIATTETDEMQAADALVNLATCEDERVFYPDAWFCASLHITAVPKNENERDWFGVSHWRIPSSHVLYYDNLSVIRNTFIERWTDHHGDLEESILGKSRFLSELDAPVYLHLENYGVPEGFRFPDYTWTDEDDDYRVHYTIKFERVFED